MEQGLSPGGDLVSLLPPDVEVVEHWGGFEGFELHPNDAIHVAGAVEARRREFAAGRWCARRALLRLTGHEDLNVGRRGRAPVWPEGFVGSLTHTQGYCAAAVAAHPAYRSLGVDAERLGVVGRSLWPALFTQAEIERLQACDDAAAVLAATVMFSAKETFFKCQHAVTSDWLEFTEAEVAVTAQGFSLQRPGGRREDQVEGRFLVRDGVVITAMAWR